MAPGTRAGPTSRKSVWQHLLRLDTYTACNLAIPRPRVCPGETWSRVRQKTHTRKNAQIGGTPDTPKLGTPASAGRPQLHNRTARGTQRTGVSLRAQPSKRLDSNEDSL